MSLLKARCQVSYPDNVMNTFPAALAYDCSALEPVLSKDAVRDHFLQHHALACADAVAWVRGTALERLSIESLIRLTPHLPSYESLFRRACQIRNHNLYWQSLQPGGGHAPWGPIADKVRDCFGTLSNFIASAQQQATRVCGSGWLWVVWRNDRVEIRTTENVTTLPLEAGTVLLAVDLWEHAYYRDFRSRRADYVAACFEKLVNWNFANCRLRVALLRRKRARQVTSARLHIFRSIV
jgi:Fe-Mn family superoxide dismutase